MTLKLHGLLTTQVAVVMMLSACGGGSTDDGGASVESQGVFLDAAVEGVRYETRTREGLTDADGMFRYVSGETVEFYIGDILLGSAPGALVLTPIELSPGANAITDPRVTNLIRFLQTLDDDYDPSNGIRITEPVFEALLDKSLSFDQTIQGFANDGAVQFLVSLATAPLGQSRLLLVPELTAQAHMRATLAALDDPGAPPLADAGSLEVIGNDASIIGDSIVPDPGLSFLDIAFGSSTIEWYEPRVGVPGAGTDTVVRLVVRFSGISGIQVHEVNLTWEAQSGERRNYGVSCNSDVFSAFPLGLCNSISIDLESRQVDIADLQLTFPDGGNPVFLNGGLAFP
jgi:hypothetical protein